MIDVLIVSAFPSEMRYYHHHLPDVREMDGPLSDVFQAKIGEKSVAFTHIGLGKLQASHSLQHLFRVLAPTAAFLTGTAGGIHTELKKGDVVAAEQCFDADLLGIHAALENTPFAEALIHRHGSGAIPVEYPADPTLLKILSHSTEITLGRVASSDCFPSPHHKIQNLRELNTLAIDMETFAFYQTAHYFKIPALAIRGISNLIDEAGHDKHVSNSELNAGDLAARVIVDLLKEIPTPTSPHLE